MSYMNNAKSISLKSVDLIWSMEYVASNFWNNI